MLIRLRATIRYYIGAIIVIRRTKSNSKYEYIALIIFFAGHYLALTVNSFLESWIIHM